MLNTYYFFLYYDMVFFWGCSITVASTVTVDQIFCSIVHAMGESLGDNVKE